MESLDMLMVNLYIMVLLLQREISLKKELRFQDIAMSVCVKKTTPWNVPLMKTVRNVQTTLVNVLALVTTPIGNTLGVWQELVQTVSLMIPVLQILVQHHTTAQHLGKNGDLVLNV
jgi:hypothetical protein